MSKSLYIGFDYGTSNCSVGAFTDGKIEQIALEGNEYYLPSLVAAPTRESITEHLYRFGDIKPASENGKSWLQRAVALNKKNDIDVTQESVSFGNAALSQYLLDPEFIYYVKSPKSFLGAGGLQAMQVAFFEDLVCAMMQHVKTKSEYTLEHEITQAVIGRPVHFQGSNTTEADTQAIEILYSAAKRCGFQDIEFLYEPLAAGYFFEQTLTKDQLVLVIDIGGGTTDCTMLQMGPSFTNSLQRFDDVLGYCGSRVGGNDFDIYLAFHALMPYLGKNEHNKRGLPLPSSQFWNAVSVNHVADQAAFYDKDNLQKLIQLSKDTMPLTTTHLLIKLYNERLSYRLVRDSELAKTSLSTKNKTTVDLSYLQDDLLPQLSLNILVDATQSPQKRIQELVTQTLTMADATPDIVYITGGSGRSPFLRELLQTQLPSSKIVTGDYFGSVTGGLTRWAHTLFGDK